MNVQRVVAQIAAPANGSRGQITEGFYIVEGDTLIMTRGDGTPVDEFLFRAKLNCGDRPEAIAAVLTKDVRRFMLGMTETEEAFARPLNYANSGAV